MAFVPKLHTSTLRKNVEVRGYKASLADFSHLLAATTSSNTGDSSSTSYCTHSFSITRNQGIIWKETAQPLNSTVSLSPQQTNFSDAKPPVSDGTQGKTISDTPISMSSKRQHSYFTPAASMPLVQKEINRLKSTAGKQIQTFATSAAHKSSHVIALEGLIGVGKSTLCTLAPRPCRNLWGSNSFV